MLRKYSNGINVLFIIALLMCAISGNFSTRAYATAAASSDGIHEVPTRGGFKLPWKGEFNAPGAVAIDSTDNVYVADTLNNRILKYDSKGTYLTQWGSEGSGNGQFVYAQGIALDNSDNVYVADMGNHRIQKFDRDGNFLMKWGSEGSENGQFYNPAGIAVDSKGNMYVVDSGNHRIQKLGSDGTTWTVWGNTDASGQPATGSGTGQFYYPSGIAVDGSDNVYVADTYNHQIQKLDSKGTWTVLGSKGTGKGQFNLPAGVAVDHNGNVYVVEKKNYRIQKLDSDGAWTVWGSRGSSIGQFESPAGIAVDSNGSVYVADTYNHRIQKLDSGGTSWTSWGSYGSNLIDPTSSIAVRNNNVYVADTKNNRILKFDSSGTFHTQWGSKGSGEGQFSKPAGITVDSSGNMYVTDSGNNRIQKLNSDGTFLMQWGSKGSGDGQFSNPVGITVDSSGNMYVTDSGNNRIQKLNPDGTWTVWGNMGNGSGKLSNPSGITVDGNGNVYVVDKKDNRILKFDVNGTLLMQWGSKGNGNGQFAKPVGIAVDSSGNVYVADSDNNRIQKFDSSGTYLTQWGSGDVQFSLPNGVTIDQSGDLYVVDTNKIRRFSSNSNTDVTGLTISSGTLSPSFTSSQTGPYTVSVATSVYEVTITPILADPMAKVNVSVEASEMSSFAYNNENSYTVPLNVGSNLISVTVTARNGMTTKTYTLNVTRISNNALLSNLAVDEGQGTLSPVFAPSEPNYTVDVSNTVSNFGFSLIKADPKGKVTVTGATYKTVTNNVYSYEAFNLMEGPNSIQIVVTAQDGTINPYSLTVNRALVNRNTDLSDLTLSSGVLSPVFGPGTTAYTSSVANDVVSLTVKASVSDNNATMTLNGDRVMSGQSSGPIDLNVGNNLITVVVTAQDTTTKTYRVIVHRAVQSESGSGGSGGSDPILPTSPSETKLTSANGQLTLPVGKIGEVSLGDEIMISIPANATDKEVKLTIQKVLDTQKLLRNKEIPASAIYEILKNLPENFKKSITLTFAFDPTSVKNNQSVAVLKCSVSITLDDAIACQLLDATLSPMSSDIPKVNFCIRPC